MTLKAQRVTMPRLLVVQVAGLGWDFVLREGGGSRLAGLAGRPAVPVFPAVTCVAQATLRTAAAPAAHGVASNGFFDRRLRRTFFWEQSSALVEGPRIWSRFRERGGRVGLLFWQQSLGEDADVLLSPAPVHRHHGGIIEACACRPADLYDGLRRRVGRPFALRHYWGPMASVRSSDWIAEATAALLADPDRAPDLCLTYLPGLDYDLQRHGPASPAARRALASVSRELDRLVAAARAHGFEVVIYGDYAIVPVSGGAIYPNRVLREHGLLAVRSVKGMSYADLHASRAVAVVDHEVAHVYVREASDVGSVCAAFDGSAGVERVTRRTDPDASGWAHERAGEVLLTARDGAWFAYDWWGREEKAPDFAAHVDIHNKPGFDPCELFWGWPPGCTGRDAGRVGGTHGKTGPGREVWLGATVPELRADSMQELAGRTAAWLDARGAA